MIDFRYHLVSIVSIFLALAVGIVLGAGPLKEDIGTRLTEQTTALRAEKTQLRTDLERSRRGSSVRDTFASVVAPMILKGRLTGKTVALVIGPGAGADLVKNTTASLVAAGAKVGSTVTLSEAWTDPARKTYRNTLTNQLAHLVKVPAGTAPDSQADTVLARALLAAPSPTTPRLTTPAGEVLTGLNAGDLINVSLDQSILSTSVVFLGGPVNGDTQQDTDARLAAYVQLVGSLDAGGSGIVVATDTNPADLTQSPDLIAAIRKDSDAGKIASTVDDADLPMGQSTLVLALEEQYAGSAGQYGLAADAKAVVPDLTAGP